MSEASLSPAQKVLALRLAALRRLHPNHLYSYRAGYGKAEGFELPDGGRLEADPFDVEALHEVGLINARRSSAGQIVTIGPRVDVAARQAFGGTRERLVLEVFYALAGGTVAGRVEVAAVTSIVGFDAHSYVSRLVQSGYLEPMTFDHATNLTDLGVVTAEELPPPPSQSAAGPALYNFGTMGAWQTGPGATAHVNLSSSFSAEQILAIIEEVREAAAELPPADKEATAEALDDLADEVKNPTPRAEKLRARFRAAAAFGGKGIDTASKLAKLAEWLGIGPPSA